MTIKQLEYFMALAKLLNYSEAAKQLYISQPALSRSIALLEEEIGVQLLIRDKHNVSLTPAGALLAQKTSKLGTELSRTIIETQQAADGAKGKLYLGVLDGLPLSPPIQAIIAQFRDSTDFVLCPVVLSLEDATKAIHDLDIDLLYGYDFNSAIDEQLEQLELYTDTFSVAVSARSQYAGLSSAYLHDFIHEKFFIAGTEASLELHRWRDACAALGFMPHFNNVVNPATQLLCVEQNLGVCILPARHFAFERSGIHRVELLDGFPLTVNLKWNRASYNPCVQVFLKLLEQLCARKDS